MTNLENNTSSWGSRFFFGAGTYSTLNFSAIHSVKGGLVDLVGSNTLVWKVSQKMTYDKRCTWLHFRWKRCHNSLRIASNKSSCLQHEVAIMESRAWLVFSCYFPDNAALTGRFSCCATWPCWFLFGSTPPPVFCWLITTRMIFCIDS